MIENLVDRLVKVQLSQKLTQADKETKYRNMIKEYKEAVPLVGGVINNKTSFSRRTDEAIQAIEGRSARLPHYFSAEDMQEFKDLSDITGYPLQSNLQQLFNLILNPPVLGAGAAGFQYLWDHTNQNITRRQLLIMTALTGLVGICAGLLTTDFRKFIISWAKARATYADDMVRKYGS